jgi:hypothetical protein
VPLHDVYRAAVAAARQTSAGVGAG